MIVIAMFYILITNTTNNNNFLSTMVDTENTVKQEQDTVKVVSEHFYSDLRTRTIVDDIPIYNASCVNKSIPEEMAMDFSRILNKPFLINNFTWSTTDARFSSKQILTLPSDMYANLPRSAMLRAPFDISAIYRLKMKLIFQVSGTPMHQGIMLLSATPPGTSLHYLAGYSNKLSANTLMAAPHAFLYANGSSSAALEVPFYANTKYLYTEVEGDTISYTSYNNDFAAINLMILSPLVAPTAGTQSLSITVYAIMEDAQFFIPHTDVTFVAQSNFVSNAIDYIFNGAKKVSFDFIDGMRDVVRTYTGLHNANVPIAKHLVAITDRNNLNTVEDETYFEKLDPFTKFVRITDEPIFETNVDEMMLNYILSKPQFIGQFSVSTTTTRGTVLWSRPITPIQENVTYSSSVLFSAPLSVFALMSKFWRGGLKIHLQSAMTNFHFCKLVVALDYSPVAECLTKVPKFDEVSNLLVSNLEFSGGGQVQTIKLPYMSIFDQIEVNTDWVMNALSHAMYYIYLDQPLVTNGSVSNTIDFNVYLSADDDFQLYGYSTLPLVVASRDGEPGDVLVDDFEAQSLLNTTTNDKVLASSVAKVADPEVVSSNFHLNSSVRDYIRRLYLVPRFSHSYSAGNSNTFHIPVAELVGLQSTDDEQTPAGIISQYFLGFNGGVKFKIRASALNDMSVTYIPPSARALYDSNSATAMAISTILTADPSNPLVARANTTVFERVKYYNNVSFYATQIETANMRRNNALPDGILEVEGVIPNMSPFRFIGDAQCKYNRTTTVKNSVADMGTLIVSYSPQSTSTQISVYAGISDESRLGFQVFAPTVYLPGYLVSQGTPPADVRYIISPYNSDQANNLGVRADPLSVAPKCYI
jgi:hypothetical protein